MFDLSTLYLNYVDVSKRIFIVPIDNCNWEVYLAYYSPDSDIQLQFIPSVLIFSTIPVHDYWEALVEDKRMLG